MRQRSRADGSLPRAETATGTLARVACAAILATTISAGSEATGLDEVEGIVTEESCGIG